MGSNMNHELNDFKLKIGEFTVNSVSLVGGKRRMEGVRRLCLVVGFPYIPDQILTPPFTELHNAVTVVVCIEAEGWNDIPHRQGKQATNESILALSPSFISL